MGNGRTKDGKSTNIILQYESRFTIDAGCAARDRYKVARPRQFKLVLFSQHHQMIQNGNEH